MNQTRSLIRTQLESKAQLSLFDQMECGLFFGDEFLSTRQIRVQWDTWKSLEDENLNDELASSMSSQPPGVIKPLYLNAKWIPFTHDGGGNHTGLDFDSGPRGCQVQVITFGRGLDERKTNLPARA